MKKVSRLMEEEQNGSSGLSSKSCSHSSIKDPGSGTSTKTPSSPTDQMLSPISKRLLSRKSHSIDDSESMKLKRSTMSLADVTPLPFPAPQLDFILGTSSKFRKLIVDQLQWSYTQMSPNIDEKAIRSEDPIELPIQIAEAKAKAIVEQLKQQEVLDEKLIITADQIVLFEQQVREKPIDEAQAFEFLSSYSNKSVSTVSAIVVTHYPSQLQYSGFDIATINWQCIPSEVVSKVIAKKEIFNCAGGFRIEDEDLQPLIRSVDGSFDSVLGFPIKLTINLIAELLSYLDEVKNPNRQTPISYDANL